eukprot:6484428-Ditylum_brightwellii.AAC.1
MEQKGKEKQYYYNKERYSKMYVEMKELFSEFMSRKCLEESHHKYDARLNEGLNTATAMLWGEMKFCSAIFEKLGMGMTDGLTDFLENNDKTCAQRQKYKKLITTKTKRKKDNYIRVKSKYKKTKRCENGLSYGDDSKEDLSRTMLSVCACTGCSKKEKHKTTSSK